MAGAVRIPTGSITTITAISPTFRRRAAPTIRGPASFRSGAIWITTAGWIWWSRTASCRKAACTQIYRNSHDGTFTNITKAAGLNEPPQYGAIGIALGDYDKDGRLDILINGRESAPNRLYHNDGGLHFTEVAAKAGVVQPPHNGFVCFFFDYNNDGWPDILTTSLAPWEIAVEGLKKGYAPANARAVHPDASRLFRNNGNGTFTDVTFESNSTTPPAPWAAA